MATLNVLGLDSTTGQQKVFKTGDIINGATAGIEIQDNGSQIVASATVINFADTVFAVTDVGGVATVNVAIASSEVSVVDSAFTYLTGTNVQTVLDDIDDQFVALNNKTAQLLSTTTGIDGKTVGTTNLYTVPAGKKLIVDKIMIEAEAFTAAVGTLAAGVGVAAGEDDIYFSQLLTGLDTTGDGFELDASGSIVIPPAASVVKLGIDTAMTGTTANLTVYLFGYLV